MKLEIITTEELCCKCLHIQTSLDSSPKHIYLEVNSIEH